MSILLRRVFFISVAILIVILQVTRISKQALSDLSTSDSTRTLADEYMEGEEGLALEVSAAIERRVGDLELRLEKLEPNMTKLWTKADAHAHQILVDHQSNMTQLWANGETQAHLIDTLKRTIEDLTRKVSMLDQSLQGLSSTPPGHAAASPYAYTFMFGGAHPDKFSSYRGYLFNILIAARIFQQVGSKADIVLWVQISSRSNATKLPRVQEKWLERSGVQLRYLPKSKVESFIEIIMEKFRILSMTEYRRILFLDSDLIPLGNLDYFFELSDGPDAILKENLILPSRLCAMCAGFFMVAPKEGDYDRAQEIMHAKYLDCYVRGIYHDPIKGWGHEIKDPDYYALRGGKKLTILNYYGSDADQGFGYHWPKYEKKSVTVLLDDRFENWGASENGTVVLESVVKNDAFDMYRKPVLHDQSACDRYMCDHKHFDTYEKPWIDGPPSNVDYLDPNSVTETSHQSARHFWFTTLYTLNQEFSLGVNFTHWEKDKPMPLSNDWGRGIKLRHRQAAIKAGILDQAELFKDL